MSALFITLTFGRIREGKRDVFEQSNATIAQLVEAEEPRVIAFHASLTEDGERFAGLQFHPDAESMAYHLQVVRDAVAASAEHWRSRSSKCSVHRTT